jgi:hypothetical protein
MVTAPVGLVAALLLSAAPTQGRGPDDPRAVVRAALRAVEGDSVEALARRWEARLRRDPRDCAAGLGLATLARLTYDLPAADRRYRQLADADSAAPTLCGVYARIGLGSLLDVRTSSDAGAYYERAREGARALGDSVGEAEALIDAAFIRTRTRNVGEALAALDTAAALLPAGELAVRARLHVSRAQMLAGPQRPEALTDARTAAELARHAAEPRTEARAYAAAAIYFTRMLEFDSADAYLARAAALQGRARDRHGLVMTLLRRGNAKNQQNDRVAARALIRQALAIAESSHHATGQAIAHNGLGSEALMLRDYVAAEEHLRTALRMFESNKDPGNAALARGLLATVSLASGNLPEARRLLDESIAWQQRLGRSYNEFQGLRMLQAIAMTEGDLERARRLLDSATALARERKVPAWMQVLRFDEGRLAALRGDWATSERAYRDYLASLDSTEVSSAYEGRARLAYVYARRGELARAEREMASANDMLDRYRATLDDRELRVFGIQAATMIDALDVQGSIAWVLAEMAAAGRAAPALDFAERRRARELADRIAQGGALRAGGGDSSSRAAAAVPGAGGAQALIAAIPDDRTAMLEYVTGTRAPTTVFVVTRGGVTARRVTSIDSLEADVGRLEALLAASHAAPALARALGAALLDSAVAALPPSVERLVIVPDGVLHRVPFDALRLPDGRAVVERFTVATAPSAAIAAALWQRPRRRPGAGVRVLAFGDPAFGPGEGTRETQRDVYRSAFDSTGGLPRLAESGREARLVARYAAGSVVRLRGDASAAYLRRVPLDSFRVLHFATHALVDERTLARTALALAPAEGESGFVTPGDLAALELDADLVVLSACRTAGGKILMGEGVQGLTAPLLQAGARAVVATSWRIRDQATVPFVRDFYDALARGEPVGDALRSAKLSAIRRGASPGEWAAFGVVGDPLVRVPLRPPPARWPLAVVAALAAAAVGAAAGVIYSTRSRRAAERRSLPSSA